MKPLNLDEIRTAVRGIWLSQGRSVTIDGVSTDTRTAVRGELYVALRGDRFDGHDFLAAAAEAGCISAIVRRDFETPPELAQSFEAGLIGVADTTVALGDLATHHRRTVPATVIAVTGSNGKTTTKRMIHHILSRRLAGSGSPKSFNNAVGVPLTLLAVAPGDDYVVCELGSSGPGEIAALSRIARPNIAVITSIGPTHLEGLGSVDRVATEKASILAGLESNGLAIVWADSEPLDRSLRVYECRTIRFGTSDSAHLRLTDYVSDGSSHRFEINGHSWGELLLPGRHNATNALAALAVAQRFGFDQSDAAEALADFPGLDMRLETIQCGSLRVINDAYNANPASAAAAGDVLADCPAKRRVMIVGDMRELGAQAELLHRQLGEALAAKGLDVIVGVGPLGRHVAEAAGQAGLDTEVFDTTEAAAKGIGKLLAPGDVILIKGSRSMGMEHLVGAIGKTPAAGATAGKPKGVKH